MDAGDLGPNLRGPTAKVKAGWVGVLCVVGLARFALKMEWGLPVGVVLEGGAIRTGGVSTEVALMENVTRVPDPEDEPQDQLEAISP